MNVRALVLKAASEVSCVCEAAALTANHTSNPSKRLVINKAHIVAERGTR